MSEVIGAFSRAGAAGRAPEFYRQAEAIDRQHLFESFEDAGTDAGRLLLQPVAEIRNSPLGLVRAVELPACRSGRRINPCSGLGSRAITLGALWI